MKSQLKMVLALILFAAVSVAQDVPKAPSSVTKTRAAEKRSNPVTAKESTRALTNNEKRGYALGVQVGADIANDGIEADRNFLLQGMRDVLTGGKFRMTKEDLNATLAVMQKEQHEKTAVAMKEFAGKNKKEGEAFLAENKVKDGVVTLTSGLQYKILKAGDGKKPAIDDRVVCNYRGTLIDGTEVDSSYSRNEPSTFPLKGIIKGWSEALQLMPAGSKWQIFVPSDLAYGERGSGRNVGPNATLIFEVELLSVLDNTQDHTKPQSESATPPGSL
jgi:FKBP-type peptidyl-prolyl cis-trans isomerase